MAQGVGQVSGGSAVTGAVTWLQELLLGSAGLAIAVISVALLGFAILQGRLSPRDGARVVLGCFLLFGAPLVAHGLRGAMGSEARVSSVVTPPHLAPAPSSQSQDPYANAVIESRRPTWP